MFAHRVMALSAAFVACFSSSSHSQYLLEVSLTYLQRHGVPCLSVLKVDTTDYMDEVVTCQDGREWVLFWLEDEVAFVQPQTHHLYKWAREIYAAHPEVYGRLKATYYHAVSASSGPPQAGGAGFAASVPDR